jgi:hypothetical protein
MWLSRRAIRRSGDAEWDDHMNFIGLSHLREMRTMDWWGNPCIEGNFLIYSLDELWERLSELQRPTPEKEYHLLFTDALGPGGLLNHPQLRLLGHDLSDRTLTSSLLNCGRWEGVLEPIAKRARDNGLLDLLDAKLAQALLPEAWHGDAHAYVTIWALYEVIPEAVAGSAAARDAAAIRGG